mmetsp:Transcript_18866/g.25922  ORF Transcript_18866/g.25922 Transcript_18866/m.25922 type:complete len:241 (-) Transcript_18866:277-999(-)
MIIFIGLSLLRGGQGRVEPVQLALEVRQHRGHAPLHRRHRQPQLEGEAAELGGVQVGHRGALPPPGLGRPEVPVVPSYSAGNIVQLATSRFSPGLLFLRVRGGVAVAVLGRGAGHEGVAQELAGPGPPGGVLRQAPGQERPQLRRPVCVRRQLGGRARADLLQQPPVPRVLPVREAPQGAGHDGQPQRPYVRVVAVLLPHDSLRAHIKVSSCKSIHLLIGVFNISNYAKITDFDMAMVIY